MSSRPAIGGPKFKKLNMGQVFIGLAVVSAIITIIIFKSLVSTKTPARVMEVKTRPLVVAAQQLYAGEILRPESLKTVDWPEKQYPDVEVYEQSEKLIGRAVKSDIYPGQPLYKMSLAGEGSSGGLPVVIPAGYRAMTILVTENKGVGGFIKPGDHVDVLGTFEYHLPEASQKAISEKSGLLLEDSLHLTQTVLQDVQILAIAQEMYEKKSAIEEGVHPNTSDSATTAKADGSAAPPPMASPSAADPATATKAKIVSSVTVAVTPEQAEKLAYADSRGELRLTLRPESEHEQLHLIGADTNDVVPLKNVIQKVAQFSTGLNDFAPVRSSASSYPDFNVPPPPKVAPAPAVMPMASAPHYGSDGGSEIQVIEGTTKSSVSF